MARTLFTNVKIFDGTGARPFAGEVLVQGNRIDKVAKGKSGIARGGAEVIDGGGGTLMPGMTEGHGHLSYTDFVALGDVSELPPEDHALRTAENAEIVLDAGFTSVFSGGALRPRMDVAVRDAIEAGRIRGPRLKASSPAFVSSGGLGDQRRLHFEPAPIILLVDGVDDMRRMGRVMVREGVDSIKVSVSGDPGLRTGAGAATSWARISRRFWPAERNRPGTAASRAIPKRANAAITRGLASAPLPPARRAQNMRFSSTSSTGFTASRWPT